ncbi:Structural maintenance of chromosomes protein 5 [Geranomyces michiganensis]|nr:Structural maintenance of chromosomes protein 5 [Geranomyces michiganensis]
MYGVNNEGTSAPLVTTFGGQYGLSKYEQEVLIDHFRNWPDVRNKAIRPPVPEKSKKRFRNRRPLWNAHRHFSFHTSIWIPRKYTAGLPVPQPITAMFNSVSTPYLGWHRLREEEIVLGIPDRIKGYHYVLDPVEYPEAHVETGPTQDDEEDCGDNEDPEEALDEAENDDQQPQPKRQRVNGKQETDEETRFPAGSIVRIRLRNFITYDSVEFLPGPNLNMIIGPNGTGKSSLVCAIALGLGGRPDALGRQKSLQDFIKDGKEKASIEIELKSKGRGGNVVVKRRFKKGAERNANTWHYNGDIVSEKVLREKMAALKVQVDNLCSFLPQEKVSEFAQMNPRELLIETERAAGNEKLTAWHEQLIKFREDEKKLEGSTTDDKKQLENLESRNAVLERDVARYRERESVMRKIDVLKMKIPWVRYEGTRARWMVARTQKLAARAAYQDLEQKTAPLREEHQRIEADTQVLNAEVTALTNKYKEKLSSKRTGLQGRSDALEAAEGQNDDLQRQLTGLQKREKEKAKRRESQKAEIVRLETQLDRLKAQLVEKGILDAEGTSQGATGGELAELQRQIEAKNVELRAVGEAFMLLTQQENEINEEARQLRAQKERLYNELQGLDNVRTQRLQLIRRENPQTYEATMWVRENQHLFEKKVFEPVCLEINAKNPAYADALEANIPYRIMLNFVTQTEADYKLLLHEMIDKRKLRISVFMSTRKLDSWQPEIPLHQIQQMGFDGYLLDYIDGPPEILSVLCQEARLHKIPISSRELTNIAEIERDPRIQAFISVKMSYKIRRAYGNHAVTASQLRDARYLKSSVDTGRKAQLEDELERIASDQETLVQKAKISQKEMDRKRKQDDDLREQKKVFTARKAEIQQQKGTYDRLLNELGIKQLKLRNLIEEEANEPPIEEQELEIKEKIKEVNIKRAKLALEFSKYIKEAMAIFYRRTIASLRVVQLAVKNADVQERMAEAEGELKRVREDLEAAVAEFDKLKAQATQELEAAKAGLEGHSEAVRADYLQMYPDETLEELETILAEQEARAETINQTDAGVIADYERRSAEIARIRGRMENAQGHLDEHRAKMAQVRNKWVPELTALVARISSSFSAAFEKIGCAGEVRLAIDEEDYDKWGIDILVKFRDSEKLHPLTGQRQSGGERSVSTILYLMALQTLSHTPFRVVDEINQGMDPRNERMVHGEMVRAACQKGTSQYFLITPKLLPDLDYHERMRVLCVFNGPYTLETVDPKQYLARRIAARSG